MCRRLTCGVIAFARFDDRNIDRLVTENRSFFRVFRDRRLQEILVIAVGEIGLVMGTA